MQGLKSKYNIPEIQMIDRLLTPIYPSSVSPLSILTDWQSGELIKVSCNQIMQVMCAMNVYSGPPVQWDDVVRLQTDGAYNEPESIFPQSLYRCSDEKRSHSKGLSRSTRASRQGEASEPTRR